MRESYVLEQQDWRALLSRLFPLRNTGPSEVVWASSRDFQLALRNLIVLPEQPQNHRSRCSLSDCLLDKACAFTIIFHFSRIDDDGGSGSVAAIERYAHSRIKMLSELDYFCGITGREKGITDKNRFQRKQ